MDKKARDELEYNTVVEESSLVHINSEQASKSLDVDFYTPKAFFLDSISPRYMNLSLIFLCPLSTRIC